ncbi:unnamed protein product [Cuscuta epithymum]|uniref:Uncharacterized protein n=1 Tax=Cuscuta epithymum TaxID=186058 RepID=A0AAV0CEP3_9ASTE|nr:unnamed protein product [Cuscuta epithymum]
MAGLGPVRARFGPGPGRASGQKTGARARTAGGRFRAKPGRARPNGPFFFFGSPIVGLRAQAEVRPTNPSLPDARPVRTQGQPTGPCSLRMDERLGLGVQAQRLIPTSVYAGTRSRATGHQG